MQKFNYIIISEKMMKIDVYEALTLHQNIKHFIFLVDLTW